MRRFIDITVREESKTYFIDQSHHDSSPGFLVELKKQKTHWKILSESFRVGNKFAPGLWPICFRTPHVFLDQSHQKILLYLEYCNRVLQYSKDHIITVSRL